MNKVIISGEIAGKIEFKKTQTGKSLCNFSILEKEKSQNGQELKSYFDCVAWGNTAEQINNNCFVGQFVTIEGKLSKSSYTNREGQKVYKVSIYTQNIESPVTMSSSNATESVTNQQQDYPNYQYGQGMPF